MTQRSEEEQEADFIYGAVEALQNALRDANSQRIRWETEARALGEMADDKRWPETPDSYEVWFEEHWPKARISLDAYQERLSGASAEADHFAGVWRREINRLERELEEAKKVASDAGLKLPEFPGQ